MQLLTVMERAASIRASDAAKLRTRTSSANPAAAAVLLSAILLLATSNIASSAAVPAATILADGDVASKSAAAAVAVEQLFGDLDKVRSAVAASAWSNSRRSLMDSSEDFEQCMNPMNPPASVINMMNGKYKSLVCEGSSSAYIACCGTDMDSCGAPKWVQAAPGFQAMLQRFCDKCDACC